MIEWNSILHSVAYKIFITVLVTAAGIPDLPVLMDIPSTTCGSNGTHEVTLQWTPPTNTGGQVIDRYLVTVSGPAGYICPTDQCNVTTTSTTLTGLECGSTYLVSVSAVNCIGEGNSTQPMMVTATPGQ